MRDEVALKAPVRAAVAEIPALPELGHGKTHGVVTDTHRTEHLADAGLRQHLRRPAQRRLLNLDRELREVGWCGPETRCGELRIDVPLGVHRAPASAVCARRVLVALVRE